MNPLKRLFSAGQGTESTVVWWELRRIPFNLIVGAVGVASVMLMELFGSTFIPPGEDFVEPLLLLAGVILFALLANIAYTLCWMMEGDIPFDEPEKHRAYRTRNFKLALKWACACATLPFWLCSLAWVERVALALS
jgi:hypothetical protein